MEARSLQLLLPPWGGGAWGGSALLTKVQQHRGLNNLLIVI